MKLNGGTDLRAGEPQSPTNCTVDYAVELGADAVGYTLYPGSNHEPRMFEAFREVQERAREYGLPCVTGIAGAIEVIETGDEITVDGFLGVVTVHADRRDR